ncbi:GRP2 [Candida metapsilosis]|uniref:GRP2 n=1 Tax=Candida metapsilosis TaxID=273372 RepID=A0A8H7ZKF3_9ASCO|nr:GRP2 [Candida metapsilosis]
MSIFVSGATGFIAQNIVKQLVQANYKVIGSVRTTEKGETLRNSIKEANLKTENFTYEVVKDIGAEGAFDAVLKSHPETEVFIHTASPVKFDVTDIKRDLIDPAINGTTNALKAIQQFGPNIKKVVVTSSISAVAGSRTVLKEGESVTEQNWNPVTMEEGVKEVSDGYAVSKKYAEQAVWDFVKRENPQFQVTTILPGLVFGPQAFPNFNKDGLNFSSQAINKLLKLKPDDAVPQGAGLFVDVRDCAKAHIVAFEKESAANKRLFAVAGRYNNQEVIDIIRSDFDELNQILPKGNPEDAKKYAPRSDRYDQSLTKSVLGFEFIGFEKSVVDTVAQLLD